MEMKKGGLELIYFVDQIFFLRYLVNICLWAPFFIAIYEIHEDIRIMLLFLYSLN